MLVKIESKTRTFKIYALFGNDSILLRARAALEIGRNIKMKQNFEKEREIFEKAIEITMIPWQK